MRIITKLCTAKHGITRFKNSINWVIGRILSNILFNSGGRAISTSQLINKLVRFSLSALELIAAFTRLQEVFHASGNSLSSNFNLGSNSAYQFMRTLQTDLNILMHIPPPNRQESVDPRLECFCISVLLYVHN